MTHEFVENIPSSLKDGVAYVSIKYETVVHKCCCGCGHEVVTPLSPTDWELIFDGETISLYPSVGNWNLDCKSHYWITKNKVIWAPKWNKKQIYNSKNEDYLNKNKYYRKKNKLFSKIFSKG